MQSKKTVCLVLVAVLSFFSFFTTASAAEPFSRDIEMVVGHNPGGGSDICARVFSNIINENNYLPVKLNVINRTGGNGAVSLTYVQGKKGDPHYLNFVTPGYFTIPVSSKLPYTWKDFTPIAYFGSDDRFYASKAGGAYKTFEDFVKDAKARPGQVRFGATGTGGSTAQLAILEMQEVVDIKLNYIPFSGGADIITAILGGHLDAGFLTVTEAANFIEAGQILPLAASGSKRSAVAPNAPTLLELGYNTVHSQMRGVVAPGNISKEAVAAYGEAFKKVSEHPKWLSDFVNKYNFTPDFKGPEEAAKQFAKENDLLIGQMKKYGFLK